MTELNQTRYSESKSITKAALEHIARKGGVVRIGGDVYEYAKEALIIFLEDVLYRAYQYNDYWFGHASRESGQDSQKPHQLQTLSIILALRSSKYNIKLVAGSELKGKLVKMSGGANNNAILMKKIKDLQKSTSTIFPKAAFIRLVRQIIKIHLVKVGEKAIIIKPGAYAALQEASESYLIKLLKDAQLQGIHAGRKLLYAKDLKMVRYMRGEIYNL